MKKYLMRIMLYFLVFSAFSPLVRRAESFVTTAGGESITWSFNGIPDSNFFHATVPCAYKADTNYWVCEYGVTDPPYIIPIRFSASVTPTQGPYPSLNLYYTGATDYPLNLINSIQGLDTRPITNNATFYIPASAKTFKLLYSSNGNGSGVTNIQINVTIANYDPVLANMLGGGEINSETEYCDESSQPGEPSIKNFNNKKGAGPGKCSKMGLPKFWVNTAALSLVVSDTDFAYAGRGPAMEMTRTYNSNTLPSYAGDSRIPMFGNGWSFAYEESVTETCMGAGLSKGSGNALFFSASLCPPVIPTNAIPPEGNFDTLVRYSGYWLYENKSTHKKYRYDSVAGSLRLTSITDRNNNVVQIIHNPNGTIQKVIDAVGRETRFQHDVNLRCVSMTTPANKTATYEYDAAGNLVKSIDLAGNTTRYMYDAANYMVSMTLGDKVTQFGYNAGSTPKRIATVTNALGHVQRYQKGSGYQGNSATDPLGNVSYYAANDKGNTERVEDPLQFQSTKTFTKGLLTTYSSPSGQTNKTYDSRGNLLVNVRSSSYGPYTSSYAYDAANNLISRTDPENNFWSYQYDTNRNRTRVTRPSGLSTTYGYVNGLLTLITDAKGKQITLGYDNFGNLASIRDPLGNTSYNTYDSTGILLMSKTDPAGNTTSYTYDDNHRVTSVTYADGASKKFLYDCCSLIAVTDENNHTTTITRNKLLKPIAITDPMNRVTGITYDSTGAVTTVLHPDNNPVTTTPDALYRPSVISDALGGTRKISYDGGWDIKSFTDENGNETTYYFDQGKPANMTDPAGNFYMTTWDKAGRQKTWRNARGGWISYDYTPDSHVAAKRNYYNNGILASFDYDAVGNLTMSSNVTGATYYGYDDARQNTSITYPDNLSVSFSYSPSGGVSSVSYPGGVLATYTHDSRNRVKSMSFGGRTIIYDYDAVGNLVGETRSNGTTSTYQYNAGNLLTGVTHRKGSAIFSQATYVRDAMGNVTSESGFSPLAPNVSAGSIAGTHNVLNQINKLGTETFGYDGDGNLASITGGRNLSAVYDNENQLVSLTNAGITTSYSYNASGQRVKSISGEQVINYHYDSNGRLLFQTDANAKITAYFFYNDRRLVAMATSPDSYYFYHFDKTGNTQALTDTGGSIVAAYAYQPFGEVISVSSGVNNPFTYVGAYGVMDDGNGVYFMQKRNYDATSGKFMQKDPLGFGGGSNLYSYAANNPVIKIDPRGENPIVVGALLMGYGLYQGGKALVDMIGTLNRGVERSNAHDQQLKNGIEGYVNSGAYKRFNNHAVRDSQGLCRNAFDLELAVYTTSAPTSSVLETAGQVLQTVTQEALIESYDEAASSTVEIDDGDY